jgi:hypothetical protein
MSKQTIRVLGILLTVCFLMSMTIAAVSADPCDNSSSSQKYSKGMMQGMQGKEMMKGKPIKIRNLIIAKNVVIINGRTTRPLMRAALLKGMMTKKGMMYNKEMMSNSGTMNTGTTTGTTEKSCTAGNTANTETENTATAEANTTDC